MTVKNNTFMSLFSQRRPRGFHHEYMFADKRKDKLRAIEEHAKEELGMRESRGYGGNRMKGVFLNATKYARRRSERRLAGGFMINTGVVLVLIVLLAAVWRLLLCM